VYTPKEFIKYCEKSLSMNLEIKRIL